MLSRAIRFLLALAAVGGEQLTTASATESVQHVGVSISPCVNADQLWVAQLVKMELSNGSSTPSDLHAVVTCQGNAAEIRLLNASDEVLAFRTIALRPLAGSAPDVRAHELALGIAELVRRREATPEENPPTVDAPAARSDSVASTAHAQMPPRIGAVVAIERSSGGQGQAGPDIAAQIPLGKYISFLVRAGARRSQTLTVTDGVVSGTALSGSLGLGARVTPRTFPVEGLVFGRMSGQGFRYAATSDGGATTRSADGVAWLADIGALGTVKVSPHLGIVAEFAGATVIHSVTIRDQGNAVSGIRGFGLSAAFGVVGMF